MNFVNTSNEILLFLMSHMEHLGINSCKEHVSESHSHARGVASIENPIPMLGGKHLFCLIPVLRGNANFVFCNTSAVRMLEKTSFLNISNGYC